MANDQIIAAVNDGIAKGAVVDGMGYPIKGCGPNRFADETLAWAQYLMPTLGFDRVCGTDFCPIWEASLGGSNVPTLDGYFNGGVIVFTGAGTSKCALNPVTPGAATYNPVIGNAFQSRATPWFIRGRFLINATNLTPGTTELVLLSMDASYAGGSGIGHQVQIVGMSTVSLNQFQIRTAGGNFAAGPNNFSAGPDGVMGGDSSLFPVNQWFTATLYFDGVSIRWAFGDSYKDVNKLDATLGQMDSMPQDAGAVTVNSSATPDLTVGSVFRVDALACAYCATQENKYGTG